MNFVILRSEGTMSIDNAAIELITTPWIAANVEVVTWRGDVGCGFIEYNDRPRVMTKTTRLEDYLYIIDRWIEAAAGLAPWQAQRIKVDLVEALYVNKRTAPYDDPTTGWRYDGADEAVAHMAAQVTAQGNYDRINELIGQIDGAFNGTASEVQTKMVNVNAGNASRVNAWLGQNAANWSGVNISSSLGQVGGGTSSWYAAIPPNGNPPNAEWGYHTHPTTLNRPGEAFSSSIPNRNISSQGFYPMNPMASVSVAAGGNTSVLWQPLAPASQQNISINTFRNVLLGIINRRVALDSVRMAKKRALQALWTIPEIVAFPVAAGW